MTSPRSSSRYVSGSRLIDLVMNNPAAVATMWLSLLAVFDNQIPRVHCGLPFKLVFK